MTYIKGNIIVEDIKIGDIHFEFGYGFYIKTTVTSLPEKEGDCWSWKSITDDGEEIGYSVVEGLSHYGPNVYDYMAYSGCKKLK